MERYSARWFTVPTALREWLKKTRELLADRSHRFPGHESVGYMLDYVFAETTDGSDRSRAIHVFFARAGVNPPPPIVPAAAGVNPPPPIVPAAAGGGEHMVLPEPVAALPAPAPMRVDDPEAAAAREEMDVGAPLEHFHCRHCRVWFGEDKTAATSKNDRHMPFCERAAVAIL